MANEDKSQFAFERVNNVAHPHRLEQSEATAAVNVDFWKDAVASRRTGYTQVRSGTIHSLYAAEGRAYYAKDSSLYQFVPGGADITIKALGNNNRLSWTLAGVTPVCANGITHILDGGDTPAELNGRFVCFYNGRLYVASNDVMFCTPAYNLGKVDKRLGYFPMGASINMIDCTDDTLWVSTSHGVYACVGKGPEDFDVSRKTAVPAIQFTNARVTAYAAGLEEQGHVVYWTAPDGVYRAGNGGRLINVTDGVFAPGAATDGAAAVRQSSLGTHYITAVRG